MERKKLLMAVAVLAVTGGVNHYCTPQEKKSPEQEKEEVQQRAKEIGRMILDLLGVEWN